uniref:Uncharacterized protein LOC104224272 n=1 Tax=Nicotiana sylvestris TaxID=4096 RepID=A0A1U7WHS4_NICSY|nr:PREDICTED: uncharacterized protein LOC104224272 [Nicotiana sylvestris]
MNIKFFHSMLKVRRNANKIFTIRDNAGITRNNKNGIAEAFVDYYTSMLCTKTRDRMRVCNATVKQGPVVSAEQRGMLVAEFTMEEMKQALWKITGDKSPGPNGYEHADTVTDYRPITCCNTIYKVVAKMLTNRLTQVLPDIISPNQREFVAGKQ